MDAPDVRGLWGGTVGETGFLLRVQGQTGAGFTGSAEILQPSGEWARHRVAGTLDPATGALSFADSAGAVRFAGTLSGAGMSGTLTDAVGTRRWTVSR